MYYIGATDLVYRYTETLTSGTYRTWSHGYYSMQYFGEVSPLEIFQIQFKLGPTYPDDYLGVSDILVRCADKPTQSPTTDPTPAPTNMPTLSPTEPTSQPTDSPTLPTLNPTFSPTAAPIKTPNPTTDPTTDPTSSPSQPPTNAPSLAPTLAPSDSPSNAPSRAPSRNPTLAPTESPSRAPSDTPSQPPTAAPSESPTGAPSHSIQLIDKWWYDDYVYNEKIDEWNNTKIGWLLHNANIDNIKEDSLLLPGAILTGTNPNIGSSEVFEATTSDLPDLSTLHGEFRAHMVMYNDPQSEIQRNFVTLQRSFECMAVSFISIWYDVLFCNVDNDLFKHSLVVNDSDVASIQNKNLVHDEADRNYTANGKMCGNNATHNKHNPSWKSFWWQSNLTD